MVISYLQNVKEPLEFWLCELISFFVADVIHTVGPQGEKPQLLAECYKNSLELMTSNGLKTIAFPCISTGIYGYPVMPAAHVAAYEVRKYLEKHGDVERVIFCIFLQQDVEVYEGILQSYFPLH